MKIKHFNYWHLIIFGGCFLLTAIFFLIINISISNADIKQIDFTIANGESSQEISQRLAQNGLIVSANFFDFYLRLQGKDKNIKAGHYQFVPPLNIKQIARLITSDYKLNEQDIFLIKEGETLLEIEEGLKVKGLLAKDQSLTQWRLQEVQDKLGNKLLRGASLTNSLEGYLFPDSYHLVRGLSDEEIINLILNNFAQQIPSGWLDQLEKDGKNFYDILILASILEKEVQLKNDKRLVADILWRRLENKMPLQVDATLCYAQSKDFRNCLIDQAVLKMNSPYNTYLYKGLPPTPINNPGLESIEAVLYPLPNDYWYYLTDRQTGQTIFSKTYKEHLSARQQYLTK